MGTRELGKTHYCGDLFLSVLGIRDVHESIWLRKTRDCFTDVNCKLERNDNGSYVVRISATSTIIVVELRRPLELLMRGKIVQHVDITPMVVQFLFSLEGINIMRTVHRETRSNIHLDKHNMHVRIFFSSDNVDRDEQRFIDSLLTIHESKQLEMHPRGELLPPDLMERRHCICINGTKEMKQSVEDIISEIAQSSFLTQTKGDEAHYAICFCEMEGPYRLEACTHAFCRSCLLEQCESTIKSREGFPMCYLHYGYGESFLLTDLKSLLSTEKLKELFKAFLEAL
ncbi:hypothetical protein CQW23_23289 [Capsicum baccatum]|uniref:RING-type domain-containing protein n=1 Tax=Capsicum baccatum TaxID=33114 RepID=A0A2G2VRH9_CAPBA|nr:hypothetical protein CQW23_23289 [Capsicum baccatum]